MTGCRPAASQRWKPVAVAATPGIPAIGESRDGHSLRCVAGANKMGESQAVFFPVSGVRMLRAPDLANDAQRVATLHALGILDTPREERFDRITRLASHFFQVPIVLVSLIDTNRQWFKSCYGLDTTETGRDISFCGHAIVSEQTFVIENALHDPRFADNPLVAGEPHIRFYAGQPLSAGDGSLVGTLCLIDRQPRHFSDQDRLRLGEFAAIVESELNLLTLAELNRQLEQSRARQRQAQRERDRIFTNSLDLLCVASLDGFFKRINPQFSKTLGFSEQEILATPYIELTHPDDRQPTLDTLKQLTEGVDVVQFESRFRCRDGSWRWLAWNCPAPRGEDQLLYAVARDITENKRVERALRESQARFQTLVEHSPEAIVLLDLKTGNFVDANPNAEALFGLDREKLLKTGPVPMSPPLQPGDIPSTELAEQRIREALAGNSSAFEWIHLRADGQLVPCEVRLVRLPGDRPLVRASITDVSWRKQAEQELRRAKEAAEAANRAKSDFLANMSHEIRTPMNAVIGMTEMVLDSELTDVQRDYLTTVMESGESLMTIINEILDFSKIEAGKLELESLPFSIRECIGDAMKSLALRAHTAGLELAWFVNADVPDELFGDASRLRQIVLNLVGNSLKFTRQGEVVVTVALPDNGSRQSDPGEVELQFAVTDTGIGIPPDRLEAIFEAFQQVDTSTTRRFGGTGLGLAICSRLVELMHGRIWVESELDRGTTFRFTCRFDVRPADSSAGLPEQSSWPGVRVLVVDDNATNRRFMRQLLGKWGMRVKLAGQARQAIDLLKVAAEAGRPVELVLTDLHMPEMDGFDLALAIRQAPQLQDTAVVMLTSGIRRGDAQRCAELGIIRHLLKPVKQSELRSAISAALAQSDAPSEGSRPVPEKAASAIDSQQILLVEDGIANQKMALAMLRKWGHQVTIANNGLEALDAWQTQPFDLVLMDVQMPEMDGYEATREIRRREGATGRRTPIIAMTAHALPADREACLRGYGCVPVQTRSPKRSVRRAVDHYRGSGQTRSVSRRVEFSRLSRTPTKNRMPRVACPPVPGPWKPELRDEPSVAFIRGFPQSRSDLDLPVAPAWRTDACDVARSQCLAEKKSPADDSRALNGFELPTSGVHRNVPRGGELR